MNVTKQGGQQQKGLTDTFLGTITRIGYYWDTMPKLVITVKKSDSMSIPFQNGERVPVPFVINGKCFTAGIRTTNRSATVMISPDLNDAELNPVRLTDLLYYHGNDMKKSRVELIFKDGVLNCF